MDASIYAQAKLGVMPDNAANRLVLSKTIRDYMLKDRKMHHKQVAQ